MKKQSTSTALFITPRGERKLQREIAIDYSVLILLLLLLFVVMVGLNMMF